MSCHCGRRYGCAAQEPPAPWARPAARDPAPGFAIFHPRTARSPGSAATCRARLCPAPCRQIADRWTRSEEHTSELQSLMRISYAVFCLKKKNNHVELSILITKNEVLMHKYTNEYWTNRNKT